MKKVNRILLATLLLAIMLFSLVGCYNTTVLSAYDVAVAEGYFTGTEQEWLESLKGKSAYDLAVEGGFIGTEAEWLDSLKSKSAYDVAVEEGFTGTKQEWLDSLKSKSAYDIAVEEGYTGTQAEWLASLQGQDGADGKNVVQTLSIEELYQVAVEEGYTGTLLDFVNKSVSSTSGGIIQVSSLAVLSAVNVWCFADDTTKNGISAGAGVIYQLDDETGTAYIITNYHVLYDSANTTPNKIAPYIKIMLYGKEYTDYLVPATYIGGSMTYDIAVIKVTNCEYLINSQYRAVSVANSDQVMVGETAIAVGNPEAGGISVTSGIVCIESETLDMTGADERTAISLRTMRIDTAVNRGNSGGGLFNSNGELIGIVNAKTISEDVENIGYAIPSNIAIGVAQNIIDNCENKSNEKALKYLLGVMIGIETTEISYDATTNTTKIMQTIAVQSVNEGAIATGYLQEGDILVSVVLPNGETRLINRIHTTIDAMLWLRQGDSVTYNIIREIDGEATEMQVTIPFNVPAPEVI